MASLNLNTSPADQAVEDTFRRLATATDVFERYTHPHASRIADLTDALAKVFNLPEHDRRSLRIAALAHDLGEAKMQRDYIHLQLPASLSADERMDLARHPVIGEQEAAHNGADKAAQLLVRWHHEWWNGNGYPDGLRQEQIPVAARILRVCDAFAALTDDRPYRPALTLDEARRHLTEWAGLEFDPRIVHAFLALNDPQLVRSYAGEVVGIIEEEVAMPAESAPEPIVEAPVVAASPETVIPAATETPESEATNRAMFSDQ